MFKYLIVLAVALVAVMAAPPQPEAPKDLDTAQQFYTAYGGYPSVYSAGLGYGYPTAYSGYGYGAYPAYSGYGYRTVYGR